MFSHRDTENTEFFLRIIFSVFSVSLCEKLNRCLAENVSDHSLMGMMTQV